MHFKCKGYSNLLIKEKKTNCKYIFQLMRIVIWKMNESTSFHIILIFLAIINDILFISIIIAIIFIFMLPRRCLFIYLRILAEIIMHKPLQSSTHKIL